MVSFFFLPRVSNVTNKYSMKSYIFYLALGALDWFSFFFSWVRVKKREERIVCILLWSFFYFPIEKIPRLYLVNTLHSNHLNILYECWVGNPFFLLLLLKWKQGMAWMWVFPLTIILATNSSAFCFTNTFYACKLWKKTCWFCFLEKYLFVLC